MRANYPCPITSEIIAKNITREGETEMVHSSFYYPSTGGSQFIADRLAEDLDIRYGTRVDHIEASENRVGIEGGVYDGMIYTGDVRLLHKLTEC